jgi:hypothetical protein
VRSITILVACTAAIALGHPALGMTLDKNVDALRAATDPSNGPPIAAPAYPKRHEFPELGGPGPYTPERAARMGLGGVAVVECALAASGRLNKCTLVADGPIGLSYGDAALKMARVGYNDGEAARGVGGWRRGARDRGLSQAGSVRLLTDGTVVSAT